MAKVTSTYGVRVTVEEDGTTKAKLVDLGNVGDAAFEKLEKGAAEAGESVDNLAGKSSNLKASVLALGGAIGGVLSVGGLSLMARRAIEVAESIATTADNIGLSTDALQELTVVAESFGVTTGDLDQALKTFSTNISDAAKETGRTSDLFKVLGVSATDSKGNLRALDDVFMDVVQSLESIESPSDRARIAVDLFGRGAADLTKFLSQGSQAMEEARQKARDMGLVLEEDLIRNATEAGDEMELLSRVISTNLNQAFLNLAPLLGDAASGFSNVAAEAGLAYERMKLFFSGDVSNGSKSLRVLKDDLKSAQEQLAMLDKDRSLLTPGGSFWETLTNPISQIGVFDSGLARKLLTQQINDYQRELDVRGALGKPERNSVVFSAGGTSGGGSLSDQLDDLEKGRDLTKDILDLQKEIGTTIYESRVKGAARIEDEYRKQVEMIDAFRKANPEKGDEADRLMADALEARGLKLQELAEKEAEINRKRAESARKTGDAEAERARRIVEGNENIIVSLQRELEALSLTEKQNAINTATRRLSTEATMAQRVQVEMLAEAIYEQGEFLKKINESEEAAAKAMEDRAEAMRELGATFSSAFEDAIVEGKKFSDVLQGIAEDIARLLIRKNITEPFANAITDSGFFGDIFGALGFAKGGVFESGMPLTAFANGGIVNGPTIFPMANGMGLMGEAGPEAVMPLRRLPSGRLGVEAAGGGGAPVNVTIINNSSAQVSEPETQASNTGVDLVITVDELVAKNIGTRGTKTRRAMDQVLSQGIIRR